MPSYKRIERLIADYINQRYRRVVEIGVGGNPEVARRLAASGAAVLCTDMKEISGSEGLETAIDDIFSPSIERYRGAELLYSLRPGVEMIPPMIRLARAINSDLLVYHLGCEIYGDGGDLIDCGVILHRYHSRG